VPARAISSGTIAFGLVSIPCKLFPSASPSDAIRFNNLHRDCGHRVRNRHYCPKHDEIVSRDDLVKGYEFAKDQYVTFEEEELKAVAEQSSGGIDICEFVPLDQVDPIYYDRAYYMAPDAGAGRAYHLLAESLRRTGLVALAKYAARGKQYLVMLRPTPNGLVMQQLHYPAEIRPAADVVIEESDLKESELALAMQLVEQGASKSFRPGEYHDEVRERVEALIAKKVEGEDIRSVATDEPKKQVIDLMSALKASLGGQGSSSDTSTPPPATTVAPSVGTGGRASAARSLAPRPGTSPRAATVSGVDAVHHAAQSPTAQAGAQSHAEPVFEPEPDLQLHVEPQVEATAEAIPNAPAQAVAAAVPSKTTLEPEPEPEPEPDQDDVFDAFDASEVPGIDDLD